jgi:hypothetical protein
MTRPATSVWAFAEHEHADLARGIDRVHDIACQAGRMPRPELSSHVLEVLRWFDGTLEPHLAWEEAWLYPEIDRRTGSPWLTRAAGFDHRQIRAMAAKLRGDELVLGGRAGDERQADSVCHLFSLTTLLRAHIEREERFLIPILVEDPVPAGISAERT